VWKEQDAGEPFRAASLASEGFIHSTEGEDALLRVLNRYYVEDPRPFAALAIDLDRVQARWDAGYLAELRATVPHIFGPLNRDAIVAVRLLRRAANGEFLALEAPDAAAR
jgi:uncharacterized protein (DUF952 family)